jgi:hypothetical protein
VTGTALLVATSGLDARRVQAAVPPTCRRPPVVLGPPEVDDRRGEATLEVPTWEPHAPVRHLLPAFAALTDAHWSARFEVSVRQTGEWVPWVGAASLGPAHFEPMPDSAGPLTADVDVFRAQGPVEAVRLRLRLRAADVRGVLAAPWLLTLSAGQEAVAGSAPGGQAAADPTAPGGPAAADPMAPGARLPVPPLSQMCEDPAIALRVCSPASVAMVMGFWGRPVDVATMAAEVYHPGLDLYGIWPAAIRAAARRGVAGYLLRFPDWEAARWCLDQGLPVIASIRYGAGELSEAAIEATTGHLVVLAGYEPDVVLVNDPAAPHRDAVARRYRLDEFRRAWLERTGVGYVLFSPYR